jgi:hypothetical protein
MPVELDQYTSASTAEPPYISGSLTSPHQELPANYVQHFEMAADTDAALYAEDQNNSYYIQMANSQSPSATEGATSHAVDARGSVTVMRAPDKELAWLKAEEEKIRKRKSELIGHTGLS